MRTELIGFQQMNTQSTQARERARRASTARVKTFPRTLAGYFATGWSRAALLSFAALLSWGALSLAPPSTRADEPAAAPPAAALPPDEVERQAEAIARSIMSPFCPGRTVSACPVAGPWREDIRKWVGEGVDPLEIKRRLAERVPEHNLMGVPKNRLGWVLPVGLGVIALGFLIFLLRYLVSPRGAGKTSAAAKPEPSVSAASNASAAGAARANGEDYDARLEQELDTLER
jgi:cytochrome c-type biogenesis protein CcmH/NrfF